MGPLGLPGTPSVFPEKHFSKIGILQFFRKNIFQKFDFLTLGPIPMDPERNFAPDWHPQTSNWSILLHFDLYLVFQLVPDRDPGTVHGWPSGQVPGLCQVLLLAQGRKTFLFRKH